MNRLTIIGNITRDPESHTTQDGKFVCNFTVAVNRRKKVENQPEADFFRIAAWGKLGENCQKYLAKGRKVSVVGPVSVNTFQAQDGSTKASLEVFAEDVEFLGGGNNSAQAPAANSPVPAEVDSDQLPF